MRLAHIAALGSSALLLTTAIAGCSDSVPAPPKGGFSVEFQKTGISCPIQSHNSDVGSGTGTLTNTDPGSVATDGTANATIDCTVSGTGTFAVDALATQNGHVLHVHVNAMSSKNTVSSPANGSVSFASPETSGTSYANPANKPCTFWLEGNEKIDTGKVWASFACDEVDSGMSACGLSSGVIVFYNCATVEAAQ